MNRNPPANIIQILRKEVGFICPVKGCNSPYLSWHHFSPAWKIKEHHNPEGMIALCVEHHRKADNNSFTNEQLVKMKNSKTREGEILSGKFDWLRNELLVIIGGNLFINVPTAVQWKSQKIISFTRDNDANLLLNIDMLSDDSNRKMKMNENVWYEYGRPKDLICPPSGKSLYVEYNDGDKLSIEYSVFKKEEEISHKYGIKLNEVLIKFPITGVEITLIQKKYGIDISPQRIRIGHGGRFVNCIFQNRDIAILLKGTNEKNESNAGIIINM